MSNNVWMFVRLCGDGVNVYISAGKSYSLIIFGLVEMNFVFGNLRARNVLTFNESYLIVFAAHCVGSTTDNDFVCPAQGGKKGKGSGEGLLQWDSERETVLQALIQLLQLDIRSLWNLSLVEEEFIRYIGDQVTRGNNTVFS